MVSVLLLRETLGPEKNKLESMGIRVLHCPLLRRRLLPKARLGGLALRSFDWILFTSATGVESFAAIEKIKTLPEAAHIGCVGPETARRLEKVFSRKCNFMPKSFTTEALAKEFKGEGRILLLRSGNADSRAEKILKKRGYDVKRVSIYRVERIPAQSRLKRIMKEGVSHVFFGANSQARAWIKRVGAAQSRRYAAGGVKFYSIGPETSKSLKQAGLRYKEADVHTFDGLIELLRKQWKKEKNF